MNIDFIKQCIKDDDVHRFYCRNEWQEVRKKVLKLDHHECQKCKVRGKYTRAEVVHHVHHLKEYPEMALDIFDKDGKRNLISLCSSCHDEEHPEKRQGCQHKEPITKERW